MDVEFHCVLLITLVKMRAFNNEILHMLIIHRILWKRNTMIMTGGDIHVPLKAKTVKCYLSLNPILTNNLVRLHLLTKAHFDKKQFFANILSDKSLNLAALLCLK